MHPSRSIRSNSETPPAAAAWRASRRAAPIVVHGLSAASYFLGKNLRLKSEFAVDTQLAVRYIPDMAEYSNYQKKVIQRFYDNRESGDEQRLAELVTNIYLSEGKKREKL